MESGLKLKDPRLHEMVEGLQKLQENFNNEKSLDLDYDSFLG